MRKAKIAALGLAAVITLAGCAATEAQAEGELPLFVTGGDSLYEQRDALLGEYRAGHDVSNQIAEVCNEWALDKGNTDSQWLLYCKDPHFSWDAAHSTWYESN